MNWEEKYNALAELVDGYRRERDEARAEATHRLDELNMARAYRRGAEAMRRRCAMWIKHNSHEDGLGMGSQRIESALAALPIPEEP